MLTLDKALLGDLETSSSPVAALGLLSRYASLFKVGRLSWQGSIRFRAS